MLNKVATNINSFTVINDIITCFDTDRWATVLASSVLPAPGEPNNKIH